MIGQIATEAFPARDRESATIYNRVKEHTVCAHRNKVGNWYVPVISNVIRAPTDFWVE